MGFTDTEVEAIQKHISSTKKTKLTATQRKELARVKIRAQLDTARAKRDASIEKWRVKINTIEARLSATYN